MQVQGRRLDGRAHPPGVPHAVRPQRGPDDPPVVLEGRVGHAGIRIASRYTCGGRSSGQPGPDQSVSMRPTCSASSRTSWRSGVAGSWNAQHVSAPLALPERVGEHGRAHAQRMRRGDDAEPADHLRVVRTHGPGHQAAPVVADHDGVRLAKRADQPRRVGRGRSPGRSPWAACRCRRIRADRRRRRGNLPGPAMPAGCRHVHQNSGKPCSSSTSGPSPLSATWKRVPFALTDRCDHGPSTWTAESAGTVIRRAPAPPASPGAGRCPRFRALVGAAAWQGCPGRMARVRRSPVIRRIFSTPIKHRDSREQHVNAGRR